MSESVVGPWAKDKLDRLEKYLVEYTKIMASQVKAGWCKGFHYIDAFAGPGKHTVRSSPKKVMPRDLFRAVAGFALDDEGQKEFLRGSPRVALGLKQPFTSYVFVEKSEERAVELETLRIEYPDLCTRTKVVRTDCNNFLRERVASNPKVDWSRNRALVFLDPFGMQVNWQTIELLAETKAIEVLVNFPVGMAIQRLLLRKGQFTIAQRTKLDEYFGSPEWFDQLYKRPPSLFENDKAFKVEESGKALVRWYQSRLNSAFGHVSRAALLRNTKGGHLYYLILASPKETGVKIANHILKAGESV